MSCVIEYEIINALIRHDNNEIVMHSYIEDSGQFYNLWVGDVLFSIKKNGDMKRRL